MKTENAVKDKSFDFALSIIELYKMLIQHHEYVLSKQLLRSGTSIGANVEEAQAAQSKRDFVSKMTIASKEARETRYWLKLLKRSKLVDTNEYDARLAEIEELISLLTSIVKTSQIRYLTSIFLTLVKLPFKI